MGTWLVLDTGEAQVHLGSAAEAYTRTRVLHADGGPDVGAAAAVLLLEFLDDARPDVHRLSTAALAGRPVTFAAAAYSAKRGTHDGIS
ncbi:hypothetical protein [Streptomyces sp. NPDC047869]|uniref:hypothetical protein n=1 Tax=Streptomyces sp. NPDC047869 TaxID=3154709 RepID=UPI00345160EC